MLAKHDMQTRSKFYRTEKASKSKSKNRKSASDGKLKFKSVKQVATMVIAKILFEAKESSLFAAV